jgi:hypothetical protein
MAGAELGGVPVSAPGAASSRTDMQPVRDIPSSYYGEGEELKAMQGAAPMYAAPAPPRPPDLFAPSARPGEPITAGVPIGEGPGPEALVLPEPSWYVKPVTLTETLAKLSQADPNSERLAALLAISQRNGW